MMRISVELGMAAAPAPSGHRSTVQMLATGQAKVKRKYVNIKLATIY